MRLISIGETTLTFSNGSVIYFNHDRDCCENNYADFSYLDDESDIKEVDFPEDLTFEFVEGSGFRFGFSERMYFVPCYSEQNGYYASDIDIYYNDKLVCSGDAERRLY